MNIAALSNSSPVEIEIEIEIDSSEFKDPWTIYKNSLKNAGYLHYQSI
jgi:hypothetical protein